MPSSPPVDIAVIASPALGEGVFDARLDGSWSVIEEANRDRFSFTRIRGGCPVLLEGVSAASVSVPPGGRFVVALGGHGGRHGRVRPEDTEPDVCGFDDLVRVIRLARAGSGLLGTLWVHVTGSYDDRWMDSLESTDDIAAQRIVSTVVGPYEVKSIDSSIQALGAAMAAPATLSGSVSPDALANAVRAESSFRFRVASAPPQG